MWDLVLGRSDSWPPGESSSALRYGVDTRKLAARRGLEVPLRDGCSGGSGAGTGHGCRVVKSAVEQDCHGRWDGGEYVCRQAIAQPLSLVLISRQVSC